MDEDLVFLWLQKATEGGHGKAQYFLGCAYEYGWIGLDVNLKNALLWLQKAADGGQGHAQWKIGHAYMHGNLELDADKELAIGVKEKRSISSESPTNTAAVSGST